MTRRGSVSRRSRANPPGAVGIVDLARRVLRSLGARFLPQSHAEPSVVYSCVLDRDPVMLHQVFVWIWTAIELAGIRPDSLVVHAMEGCDERGLRALERMGVRVVPCKPFPGGPPTCNKLVQLSSEVLREVDRVVLCDCDVAWCRALGSRLGRKSLQAKIVDFANPPFEVLRTLFREAGLGEARVTETSFLGETTYVNNCNGGLYIIPAELFRRLEEPWTRWAHWVRDNAERLGAPIFYTDQMALALSLQELGEEVEHLPLEFNCPTHIDLATYVSELTPRLIHFHRALDPSGFLKAPGVTGVDRAIERINDVIARRRRRDFDNSLFWEFRYRFSPELGSGVGSRGDVLARKRETIEAAVKSHEPCSVLDVGCGDLEVMREATLSSYTGVDLSATAIEIAREKRPDWEFHVGDAREVELVPHDVVSCFDVLIHMPTREEYESLVERLISLADRAVLLSGYDEAPRHMSEITFFWEPLRETLGRHPDVGTPEIIGTYRDTSIVLVPKRSERHSSSV